MPVTDYVQAFCDSLDSVDTPPPESFLQLLEEECPSDSLDSVDTPPPESFLQLLEEECPSDSLNSVDTPLPESFLQLLEECPTGLDSGTIQGSEPSDCNDLSFLQDLLSPDEWEQVMDDVRDFDVQDFNVEAFAEDWLEDMTSSDEGIDLLYDLVS